MSNAKSIKIKNLLSVFQLYPQVKLVYFFGSRARGKEGPMSDYDFAVYLDEKDAKKRFETKLSLMSKLSQRIGIDEIDVVVLNDTENPELKYSIIKEGKLIFDIEPYKVFVEPKIFNEYFDFMYSLRKYGLTKT